MSVASAGVYVPASTANLGPGFDCLGMALGFGLRARAVVSEQVSVRVLGEGSERLATDERNLVYRAIQHTMEAAGVAPAPVELEVHSEIPLARGLGSSSAAIVAGVLLGNALTGNRLSQDELLRIAWKIEGHPDNVAPALLGGCVISVVDGDSLHYLRIAVPEALRAVLFIPNVELPTAKARAVMPESYSRADCVFNLSRSALLVGALMAGRLDLLQVATQDRIHQPPRSQVFPALPAIIDAANRAGAAAAFLSGAGSTVCALTIANESELGAAMVAAAGEMGVDGTVRVTRPSAEGARIEASVEQTWE